MNLDENNLRGSFAEIVSCGGSHLCKTFQPRIVMMMMVDLVILLLMMINYSDKYYRKNYLH